MSKAFRAHQEAIYKENLGGKEYSKPCLLCGATKRTESGQDPCIENLPGVIHACCGHGRKQAYVMLENGLLIRGRMEFEDWADNRKHNGL